MALNTRQQGRRLPPEIFDLPVDKMREGYYTDAYFNHTRSALLADGRHPRVVMQVFQKHQAVLGGMDEAIAILKLCSEDWDALTVHALYDGDRIDPWETVMTVEGDYTLFAHLETVYLGVLARRTLISTNVKRVLEAAAGKPIIFMPARHDHHRVQTGDGYAAHVAGRARRRRDRRHHRRAVVVVGRPRDRHGPARADRRLRRQHGARGDEVRRVGAGRLQHRRARRLRERLRADVARGRPRAQGPPLGRPARHVRTARRPGALERDGRLRPARRERAAGAEGSRGARPRRVRAREDRRLGRVHGRPDPGVRAGAACRSTPTASARP